MNCHICKQALTEQEINIHLEHYSAPGDERRPPLCGKASCIRKWKRKYKREEKEEKVLRIKEMHPRDRKRLEDDLSREGRARKSFIKGHKKYRDSLSKIVGEMRDAISKRDHRRFRGLLDEHLKCLRELRSNVTAAKTQGDWVELARDLIYDKYAGIIVDKFVKEFNLSEDFSHMLEPYVKFSLDQIDYIERGAIQSYKFEKIDPSHAVYKYLKPYNFTVAGEVYKAPQLPPPLFPVK